MEERGVSKNGVLTIKVLRVSFFAKALRFFYGGRLWLTFLFGNNVSNRTCVRH